VKILRENNYDICCRAEISESKISVDDKEITVYGIRFFTGKNLICEYHDITDDKDRILFLCSLFDEYDVDPSHIDDIVSDFVTQLQLPC
jgi:hypothetical protein